MASLETERAPPLQIPRAWTSAALCWGLLAGAWLAWHGEAVLGSRWAPDTIALVHVWTLGVFGNAMLGSLWQFLPVVAGIAMPGSRAAGVLMVAFNAGTAALVLGLSRHLPALLWSGAALLAASLLVLVAGVGVSAWPTGLRNPLRLALMAPLAALVLAVSAGLVLVWWRSGHALAPHLVLADIHAALAVMGWVLGLLLVVGSVVMPMFQGSPAPRPALVTALAWGLVGMLLFAAWWAWPGGHAAVLLWLTAVLLLASGPSVLVLQARARHVRNLPLRRAWALGAMLLSAGGAALLATAPALLAGALVLGGLWLLVVAMLLEIRSFLAWLSLQRACGRGIRLPGVHQLLPDREKSSLLVLHAALALALPAAVLAPALLGRVAGGLGVLGFAVLLAALARIDVRCRRFVAAAVAVR